MKHALWIFALISTSAFAAATDLSMGNLFGVLIYLVLVALIFYAIWWFIGYVGIPEPFDKVVRVVVGLIALIVVVNLLLGLMGQSFINFR